MVFGVGCSVDTQETGPLCAAGSAASQCKTPALPESRGGFNAMPYVKLLASGRCDNQPPKKVSSSRPLRSVGPNPNTPDALDEKGKVELLATITGAGRTGELYELCFRRQIGYAQVWFEYVHRPPSLFTREQVSLMSLPLTALPTTEAFRIPPAGRGTALDDVETSNLRNTVDNRYLEICSVRHTLVRHHKSYNPTRQLRHHPYPSTDTSHTL